MADDRWVKPIYNKRAVNNAGETIRAFDPNSIEYKEAIKVLNNWREAHAYPMQVIYVHLRQMRDSKNITVASRLKRKESIENKLKREPEMQLWRMHDLGGCRFVVDSVEEVYKYVEKLKSSRVRHLFKRDYDYIDNPKKSGYRSYHVVLQYRSDRESKAVFTDSRLLIEIQFRTKLQHIWATTVETFGRITDQELKSSLGDEDIKYFFKLVSSLFALKEGCNIVSGTPSDKHELINEARRINNKSHILDRLEMYKNAIYVDDQSISTGRKKKNIQYYYLLDLEYREDVDLPIIVINSYRYAQDANAKYAELEADKTVKRDVVLVRSDSFSEVKKAFPNYFSEISSFLDEVHGLID